MNKAVFLKYFLSAMIAAWTLLPGAIEILAAPRLAMHSVTGFPGQTLSLPLSIAGADTPCFGINATVHLPGTVTFNNILRATLLAHPDFYLAARPVHADEPHVVALLAQSTLRAFSGSGPLCELVVTIPTNATPGDYPLILDAPDRAPPVRGSHALSSANGQTALIHTASDGILYIRTGAIPTPTPSPTPWPTSTPGFTPAPTATPTPTPTPTPNPCSLSLSPSSFNLQASSFTTTVSVVVGTGCWWNASVASGNAWLAITATNGNAFIFTAAANTNARARTGSIYVTNNISSQTVNIRQKGLLNSALGWLMLLFQ